ncbi:IS110 family transposase [Streptomyces sp. NPDC001340]
MRRGRTRTRSCHSCRSCRPTFLRASREFATPGQRGWGRDGFHAGCPRWLRWLIPLSRHSFRTADETLRTIAWYGENGREKSRRTPYQERNATATANARLDTANESHRLTDTDDPGHHPLSHQADNNPTATDASIGKPHATETEHGPDTPGPDTTGATAALPAAILPAAGLHAPHLPRPAANRTRRRTQGDENTPDPHDTKITTEQATFHSDLHVADPPDKQSAHLRLLVNHPTTLDKKTTTRITPSSHKRQVRRGQPLDLVGRGDLEHPEHAQHVAAQAVRRPRLVRLPLACHQARLPSSATGQRPGAGPRP